MGRGEGHKPRLELSGRAPSAHEAGRGGGHPAHTGKVMSLGGANGWRYAKVRVIEHAPGPAPVPEPENSSDIELCSIAQFLEQVGVLLPEAPLPSAPARAAAVGKFRPVLVLDLDGTLI